MKKTVAILVLVLAVVSVQAQNLVDENFSGDFPPEGWTLHTENSGADTWVRDGDRQGSAQITAGGGSTIGLPPPPAPLAQRSMLITKAIEIPDVGFYELSFFQRRQWNRGTWRLAVLVSTTDNNPESFSQLQAITPPPAAGLTNNNWGTWTETTAISLAQFRGQTIYLAFLYENFGGFAINWRIDDVVVRPTQVVRHLFNTPANNTVAVRTDQNIVATFGREITEGSNFANIAVNPPIAGGFTASIDENNVVLSHGGLDYGTVYTVTLPAGTVAGFNTALTWSFRTEQDCPGAIESFPWTQNFPSVTVPGITGAFFPPECWRVHRENTVAPTWVRSTANTVLAGTPAHARHEPIGRSFHTQTSWLITEAIEVPETENYHFSFFTRFHGAAETHAYSGVWISTSTNDVSEFTEFGEVIVFSTTAAWTAWNKVYLSLADFRGQRIYLAFKYQSNPVGQFSHGWDITNIAVERTTITECAEPYDLSVSGITKTAASFAWSGEADQYLLSLFVDGVRFRAVPIFGGQTTHNATGLPVGTDFTWNVAAICGPLSAVVWGEPFYTIPDTIKFSITAFVQGNGVNLDEEVATGNITIRNESCITLPGEARFFSATLEVNGEIVGTEYIASQPTFNSFLGIPTGIANWTVNGTRIAATFPTLRMDLSEPGEHRIRIWLNSFDGLPTGSIAMPTDTFERVIYNRQIDAGVVEIIAVVDDEYIVLKDGYNFTNFGDADYIQIRVANLAGSDIPQIWGSATVNDIRLHGGANQQFLPTVADTLHFEDTLAWTFPNTVNFTATGNEDNDFTDTFEIVAWARGVSIAGPDLDPENDTLRLTFTNRNVRDLHMVDIAYPQTAVALTTAEQVHVTVGNRGTWEITDASIELWLDDYLVATEELPAMLAGDVLDFVFDATLDLSALQQTYDIKVVIVYADDRVASNDTLRKTVTNLLGVIAKTPYHNEGTIARNAELFVTFSQDIVATELPIDGIIITYDNAGEIGYITNVEATLYGAVVAIMHGGFAYETRYTVTIPIGAIPGYEREISWSFTVIDEPPILVATTPGTDAANITLAANVTVIFNRTITATDAPLDGIIFYPEVEDVRVFFADATIIIAHGGFSRGTTYTVTIPVGIVDRYEEVITWSFTTREDAATGIEILNPSVIAIFPNPVDDILHIETTEMVRRIEIYNAQGVRVMATEQIANFIDVSPLPSGVYIIRFITDNGIVTQRFIKR